MVKICLTALSVFVLIFVFMSAVQAQSPQQTLTQYISDLQKNPNDNALREKIIKHVQTMRPAPAVPEEAKRYIARGKAAFKGAKEVKDFNEAVEEFKKALLAAPWLAEGYYNLGIVQDKAGQYAAAMDSLKLYIMSAPNAPDVEKVKELIYEIEYRKEKAAKESSPETIVAKQQNAYEAWLKSLDGARFVSPPQDNYKGGTAYIVYYIEGNKVHLGWFDREPPDFKTAPIRQVEFANKSWSVDIHGKQFVVPQPAFLGVRDFTATISDDGQFITFDRGTSVYKRVK